LRLLAAVSDYDAAARHEVLTWLDKRTWPGPARAARCRIWVALQMELARVHGDERGRLLRNLSTGGRPERACRSIVARAAPHRDARASSLCV
jgi:hypothetical protein